MAGVHGMPYDPYPFPVELGFFRDMEDLASP
jgi:hypothetical protein